LRLLDDETVISDAELSDRHGYCPCALALHYIDATGLNRNIPVSLESGFDEEVYAEYE